jgi:hypothetical protein
MAGPLRVPKQRSRDRALRGGYEGRLAKLNGGGSVKHSGQHDDRPDPLASEAMNAAWCGGNLRCPLAVFLRALAGAHMASLQTSLPDYLDAKEGFVLQAQAVLPHLDQRLPSGIRVTARRPNGFRALSQQCLHVIEFRPETRLTGPLPFALPQNQARHRAYRERAELATCLHSRGMTWAQIAARIGVIPEWARQIVLQHRNVAPVSSTMPQPPLSSD